VIYFALVVAVVLAVVERFVIGPHHVAKAHADGYRKGYADAASFADDLCYMNATGEEITKHLKHQVESITPRAGT
jgi:hypothetical protein